jgi:hypothetical protein
MALSIVGVQGARVPLAMDSWQDSFLFIPGTSDYVTGGYVITNTLLAGFASGKIRNAWVSGANSTAQSNGAIPTFALAQVGTGGGGWSGYTQFLFYVYVLSTGAQVASSGNLSGAIWEVTVQGY